LKIIFEILKKWLGEVGLAQVTMAAHQKIAARHFSQEKLLQKEAKELS
jgi:hypothetical protein